MKTITASGVTLELTPERRRRITADMNEAQRKLDKELSYSQDLQRQEMIESYRKHITKLEAMLS